MKKVAFIFLLLFISNNVIAYPISERQQAVKNAERDAQLVSVDNFFIGAGTGFGLSIFTSFLFLSNFFESTSSRQFSRQLPAIICCVLGASTPASVYLMEIPVPAMKILGKSPEYVHYYTKTYQNNVRRIRAGSAALGCLTGCVVSLAFVHILIVDYMPELYY